VNASLVLGAARPPTIAMPDIRYLGIMPEIVLLGGAVVLLAVASLVRRPLRARVSTAGTVAIAAASLGVSLWQWADVEGHGAYTTVDKAVVVDGFSALVAVTVSGAMLLTALVADGYLRREGIDGPELHVLALASASGAVLMGAANDLIIVFLGLEILSIALYVLAAYNHRRLASGESALKYFLLGSFSSAVFAYGIALTYGATGSTGLTEIPAFLAHNVLASDGLLLAGMALLLVGFAFKVAAVPFHMWTPDVYQGAPSPVTGFMAAVAKTGGFAALLRVFVSSFGVMGADWRPVVYVVAIVTLVVGAVLALVQRDVKRMLAYSSINHAGFVLLGVQAATGKGVSAALYYLFAYAVMVVGTFGLVTYLGRSGDRAHDIAGYRGLAARQPAVAFALAVLLLAQAGVPFTTGFLAKLQVVVAAVDAGSAPLAFVAMASAAVAGFFYLRLVVLMYSGTTAGAPEPLGPLAEVPPEPAASLPSPGPVPLWAGTERSLAVVDRLNVELLLEGAPPIRLDGEEAAEEPGDGQRAAAAGVPSEEAGAARRVPIPLLAAVAVALCVLPTIVFGIAPSPLVDFAHKSTLLFLP